VIQFTERNARLGEDDERPEEGGTSAKREVTVFDCQIRTSPGGEYVADLRAFRARISAQRDGARQNHIRCRVHAPYSKSWIDVLVRCDNLYLTGIGNQHGEFVLKDHFEGGKTKSGTSLTVLGFGGHYNDLAQYVACAEADTRLDEAGLTATSFDTAIHQISLWRPGAPPTSREKDSGGLQKVAPAVRSLLRVILMVSEAARFFPIGDMVARALAGGSVTRAELANIDRLVREWEKRSGAKDPGVAIPHVGR
jgi:hypothetical protein